jgi:hemolysin D
MPLLSATPLSCNNAVNSRKIPLQSGMSVAVNLKIRQRTVMSIFTDLFVKNVESLKFVR